MNNPTNVFVTESNVEMYLSRAYECLDGNQRDLLLRLVMEEETRMGKMREHMEHAQRRLDDCRERVRRQREVVLALPYQDPNRAKEQFLLETFEKTLLLLEEHQRVLGESFRHARL
jgi:hypothetical protein